mmetsp:Transcript_35292/g.76279  ORF Transcript_35292/g.76279 Transcript_35292/m.76279 type:complete len:367 (+) Transcript_35292:1341-2441(+)
MSRKGIAKEDGQEDNGEMDHVHRAVIDGLHHNVQSRVRLKGLEKFHHQNEEVSKKEAPQYGMEVIDLPGQNEDLVDPEVQQHRINDLRHRVHRQKGLILQHPGIQFGLRNLANHSWQFHRDFVEEVKPDDHVHKASQNGCPIDQVPELEVILDAIHTSSDGRQQFFSLLMGHSQQNHDEEDIWNDVEPIAVGFRHPGLMIEPELQITTRLKIPLQTFKGEHVVMTVVEDSLVLKQRYPVVKPVRFREIAERELMYALLQVVRQYNILFCETSIAITLSSVGVVEPSLFWTDNARSCLPVLFVQTRASNDLILNRHTARLGVGIQVLPIVLRKPHIHGPFHVCLRAVPIRSDGRLPQTVQIVVQGVS